MEPEEKIRTLAERVSKQVDQIQTEEATKTALVLPFLQALGYDVFNPSEVIPEFTADVGIKKGEKVDFAIAQDGIINILMECKTVNNELSLKHASQLFRYFSVTDARFAILTNGIEYQFYSDLEHQNKMDDTPFLIINITKIDDYQVSALRKFTKINFDVDGIINSASYLKYHGLANKYLSTQFESPDDDFVKFVGKQFYSGQMRSNVVEEFRGLIKRAIDQIMREWASERIRSALDNKDAKNGSLVIKNDDEEDIVTTDEERFGFDIIRAISSQIVPPSRVFMRDSKSYCAVLFDDNNRKPICRLRFNASTKKYIGLFDNKIETKIEIQNIEDIYNYSDKIRDTIKSYMEG